MGNGKVRTMQDWMNEWLTTFIQPNRAAKTYSCYKAVINILGRECPQLSRITPHIHRHTEDEDHKTEERENAKDSSVCVSIGKYWYKSFDP